jgi:molybdopterin-guanine dinucleotide biosynthesis protein
MRPAIVAVGGFESDTGKTTLVCELLRELKGWEAIKVSRGHYRSCGRDPLACCISPLLGDEPVVRSGRTETFAPGKDTGRFWESGASNVHWVIVKDAQVEAGVRAALGRVKSRGVLIEGNSFLRFVEPDFSVVVARPDRLKIKPSARRALSKASALYFSAVGEEADDAPFQEFEDWMRGCGLGETISRLPVFTRRELPQLVKGIETACEVALAAAGSDGPGVV